MKKVGFVGWRGMVGSVLIDRMTAERDWHGFEAVFFSTSQAGEPGPDVGHGRKPLRDANDLPSLAEMDIVVTCQGGDWTNAIHPKLREAGWNGHWVDAASALRMKPDSVIVLDPVNRDVMDAAIAGGKKDFIGGNCTVSLLLMGIVGLLRQGWVEWISTMTYQAASGAGAANMKELVAQMGVLAKEDSPAVSALELERRVTARQREETDNFGAPLAGSLIPWIDKPMDNGQTREEWKSGAELNKILATRQPIPVDGICVRVAAMRCHSQGLTIKLRRDIPMADIEAAIRAGNPWATIIPNDKASTLAGLSPAAVSGKLEVPVGRLRKMVIGPEYLTAFTVGDQLLWGAAEPVRRTLLILLGRL
jgi:aspartate-semialdehyde dehydrogenase